NLLFKLGFLVRHRNATVVLDEGVVHASWSLVSQAHGSGDRRELLKLLAWACQACGIEFAVVRLVAPSDVIQARLARRSSRRGGRHRLAPGGKVDQRAFERALRDYDLVDGFWSKRAVATVVVDATKEPSRKILADLVVWISSLRDGA